MGKFYHYALSVDLGVASIGAALVQLNNDGHAVRILDAGVRTFDIPLGGAERRGARQVRRTLAHRKARLQKVRNLLQKNRILPIDATEYTELMAQSPYRLRAYGARHIFNNLYELGRCLMHMAKFRGAGFLGQQEEENSEESANAVDKAKTAAYYRNLERSIAKDKVTLGEFFYGRLCKKDDDQRCIRRRARFIEQQLVDYAVPRFLVRQDFSTIWDKQSSHYASLTPELKTLIERCIFIDKGHAPYANGLCSLDPESGEVRLPKLHRLAEEKRIYEQVNNLRYQTSLQECALTKEMRDALVACALQGEILTKTSVKEKLQAFTAKKITRINMEGESSRIKPLCHVLAFADIPHWKNLSDAEKDALLEFIAEPKTQSSTPRARLMPEEDFLQECASRLHVQGDKALYTVAKSLSLLPADRTALGKTAMERILRSLKEGEDVIENDQAVWRPITYSHAMKLCGYTAEAEKHRAQANSLPLLPYYGEILRHDVTAVHPWHIQQASAEEATFGRIPNPVVHVALNQLRKVVNEIVGLYGKPQRIHIEFSREFGLSAKRREEIFAEQQKQAKQNEIIDKALQKLGLRTTRKNRIKYRLWEEQGHCDIYTLAPIQASDFSNYDVDHIIPQSIGGTDTFANLALTASEVNKAKGDAFPYDFIQRYAPDNWQHIFKRINDRNYMKAKRWRFLSDAQTRFTAMGDEEQTDHRMTDTSYMAKMAARYLSVLCENIVPLRGAITARMRHLWGLDGLEYELMDIPLYKELRDTYDNVERDEDGYAVRNPLWKAKPRIDHRHHAIDAIVLACVTRSMVQMLTRAERRGEQIKNFPPPFGIEAMDFRTYVLETLKKVKVSPKSEHGLEGQLHDATKYRVLCPAVGKEDMYVITYQRGFASIKSKKDVENITCFASEMHVATR